MYKPMHKPLSFLGTSFLLMLVLASMVYGQDAEQNPSDTQESQAQARPIEEITVLGQQTTFQIRQQIETAETEVYALFNELNSNDEFDVSCTEEVFTGSLFKRRVCMANYLREAEREAAGDYVSGVLACGALSCVPTLLTLEDAKHATREKAIAMEQEMLRIAQENMRFAEALIKLTRLVGQLESNKRENPLYFGR